MEKNSCPACGASVPHVSTECTFCGSALTYSDEAKDYLLKARKCPGCGVMNSPESVHCANCSIRILEPCNNCATFISTQSKHCTKCGAVHFSQIASEEGLPTFDEVATLSHMGRFSEANDLFEKMEKSFTDSPEFYTAWITNYLKWAMSMDTDRTMHSFSAAYRQKARNILAIAQRRFPDNPVIKRAEDKVSGGLRIKEGNKKVGCFVATAVYQNENCEEVLTLRTWRDTTLAQHKLGRLLIVVYYRIGPYISQWIQRHDIASTVIRQLLDVIVRILRYIGS